MKWQSLRNNMDQPKIERMLRLMRLMSDNINFSVEDLPETLEMSDRTIYRYVDSFKNAERMLKLVFNDDSGTLSTDAAVSPSNTKKAARSLSA